MLKPKILCVAQCKGGVGKTTTSVHVAAALAMHNRSVLIVDNDPQFNSTISLLPNGTEVGNNVRSLYFGGSLEEAVYPSVVPNLDIVPASMDLATVELEICGKIGREKLLRKSLTCDYANRYDYIIIDTPPTLGSIVINALSAADELLIPIKGFYSLEGINTFLEIIDSVRENVNPDLTIGAVVMTMFDERTILCRDILSKAEEVFGDIVAKTTIPVNVRLDEAPSYNQTVFEYSPECRGAHAYTRLTEELLSKWED